jgi:hypothetical protein
MFAPRDKFVRMAPFWTESAPVPPGYPTIKFTKLLLGGMIKLPPVSATSAPFEIVRENAAALVLSAAIPPLEIWAAVPVFGTHPPGNPDPQLQLEAMLQAPEAVCQLAVAWPSSEAQKNSEMQPARTAAAGALPKRLSKDVICTDRLNLPMRQFLQTIRQRSVSTRH